MNTRSFSIRLEKETLNALGYLARITHRNRASVIRWLIWKECEAQGLVEQSGDFIGASRIKVSLSGEGDSHD